VATSLANGATVMMYEGAPDWPQKDALADHQRYGVTIFYTRPTAIRASCVGDDWRKRDRLRACGCSLGREPINTGLGLVSPVHRRREMPVVDTWWQTETGAIMITPRPA